MKFKDIWNHHLVYLIYLQNFRALNFRSCFYFWKGATIFRGCCPVRVRNFTYYQNQLAECEASWCVGDPYHSRQMNEISCASNGLQMPFMGKIPETLAVDFTLLWCVKNRSSMIIGHRWTLWCDILHLQTSWVTRQSHPHLRFNFYQILEVLSCHPSKLLPRDDRPLRVENDCSAFKNWDSDALPIGFCTIFWAKGFPLRQILVKSNRLEIQVNLLSMMEGYLSL